MKFKSLLIVLFCTFFSACGTQTAQQATETFDVCIYGATSAGVIAGYTAAQMGKKVIIINPNDHTGGLSSGGLGKTDIGNKYAVVGLSRDFYRRLGQKYGTFEQWNFEPKMASAVFSDFLSEAGLEVRHNFRIVEAEKQGTQITSAIFENALSPEAEKLTVQAKQYIDCTYEGDLMARAGVSYTVGREANSQYGETYNGVQLMKGHQFPDGIDPYQVPGDPESGLLWGISDEPLQPDGTGDDKIQAYNFRICLARQTENRLPIERPANYDSTRYELLLRLVEHNPERRFDSYFIWSMMPNDKTDINNRGGFSTDMIGMNHNFAEADYKTREQIVRQHADYTKGLLYFMSYDERVPAHIRTEMQEWGYPKDEYVNHGHWSPQLYVRETRRMVGQHVMTEHHCTGEEVVNDPIGLAAYTMDSHNCQRIVIEKDGVAMVKNEGNVEIGGFPPYPIGYGSLVPKAEECTNLLVPVCLSASHIAYGSIRMEPVFMVMAQVSAIAASMAIDGEKPVQQVDYREVNLLMESDPLLNGTAADILVDNGDSGNIEFEGEWETREIFMRTYKNSLNLSQQALREGISATFKPEVARVGAYQVYFYCPEIYRRDLIDTGEVAFAIEHASGTDTVRINPKEFAKGLGGWAPLGSFSFDEGQQRVKLLGSESQGRHVADALLLVPVQSGMQ